MEQHYREHVIVYDTTFEHKSKEWLGTGQVRFSEGVKVRIVSVPVPAAGFKTKESAEEAAVLAARRWVDHRLDSNNGPFSRKKKAANTATA